MLKVIIYPNIDGKDWFLYFRKIYTTKILLNNSWFIRWI